MRLIPRRWFGKKRRPTKRTRATIRLQSLENRIVPNTYIVTNAADGAPAPAGSLRAALESANANQGADTITFDPSFFNVPRTITLTAGELLLHDSFTITGPGQALLSVSGNNATRVFEVASSVTGSVSDLTVTGGNAAGGYPGGYGGGFLNFGTLNLTAVTISGNSAGYYGGAVYNSGALTLASVTLGNNTAAYIGGAVFNSNSGTFTVADSTFANNSASAGRGGAVYAGGTLAITESTFTGNTASHGGAIYFSGILATVAGCTISGNMASGGGGINITHGTVTVSSSTFSGNSGGGLNSAGGTTLTLTNCTVANNTGRGIQGGAVTVTDCTVADNSGGGISGASAVTNSTVSGNTGTGIQGATAVTNCTVAYNTSAGIENAAAVTNCTVAGNGLEGVGGGAAVTVSNSIVAGNSTTQAVVRDLWGHATVTFSLIGTTYDTFFDAGSGNNLTGVAPLLRPLGDYGGSTQTMPPYGGSRAIDAGNESVTMAPLSLTTDQRGLGFPRKIGPNVDMGAVEVPAPNPTTYTVYNNLDGSPAPAGSLRAAIDAANANIGADTITFDPTFFNVPRTITLVAGELAIYDSVAVTGPGQSVLAVSGNNAGRIFDIAGNTTASLSGLTITGGKVVSDNGGAIRNTATLTVTNSTLSGNSATGPNASGGAICSGTPSTYYGGPVTLTGVTFSGNSANNAGGAVMCFAAELAATGCLFTGNSAGTRGAAIDSEDISTLALNHSTISGNASNASSVESAASMTMTDSTISGNTGRGLSARDGGTVTDSTFSGNYRSGIVGGGTITVTNCTVANNGGDGIDGGAALTVANCTVVNNGGVGIESGNGTLAVANSIVAGNNTLAYSDLYGHAIVTFSLIGRTDGLFSFDTGSGNNIIGQEPLLGPLGSYGGPTQTIPLMAGSPAIDAGDDSVTMAPLNLAYDQRGTPFARKNGLHVDIGAYEAELNGPPTANAGGPYGILEGQSLTLDAAASHDPDGDMLTFSWDANGDGVFGDASGISPTLSWSQLNALGITNGPHTNDVRVRVDDGHGHIVDSAATTLTVNPTVPSIVQGLVYVDFNDDGQVDFGEHAIPGVTVTLTGIDDLGHSVNTSIQTDANGIYSFSNLRPSNSAGYTITESQPAGYPDGIDSPGTINGIPVGLPGNDVFTGIIISQGSSLAENYNFGERPATSGNVSAGQTATIGFWQNNKGQALINALNGGANATQLGHWLAVTFPNMYRSLDGMTDSGVAAYYKTLFARNANTSPGGPPKTDAQVMATALAVYVTNQTLAGNMATAYGFQVTQDGVGTRTFNVGSRGTAFGVANNSSLSVMDLLLAVNARSHNGLLYDMDSSGQISSSEASYRTMANDLFNAINEAGGI